MAHLEAPNCLQVYFLQKKWLWRRRSLQGTAQWASHRLVQIHHDLRRQDAIMKLKAKIRERLDEAGIIEVRMDFSHRKLDRLCCLMMFSMFSLFGDCAGGCTVFLPLNVNYVLSKGSTRLKTCEARGFFRLLNIMQLPIHTWPVADSSQLLICWV